MGHIHSIHVSHSDYVNIIMAVFVAASTIGAANGTLCAGARCVTMRYAMLENSWREIHTYFTYVLSRLLLSGRISPRPEPGSCRGSWK